MSLIVTVGNKMLTEVIQTSTFFSKVRITAQMNEHTHQSQHLALSVVCDSVFATAELKKKRIIRINQESLMKTDAQSGLVYETDHFKRLHLLGHLKLLFIAQRCGGTLP